MAYEIVSLPEKTFAGLSARTSNHHPKMMEIVKGLWAEFFRLPPLPGRYGQNTFGLYTDYENGTAGAYTLTVGVQLTKTGPLPEGIVPKTIPAGRYARFYAPGSVETVAGLWQEIWKTPLDRAFTGDFEEYMTGAEGALTGVCVYIALNGV